MQRCDPRDREQAGSSRERATANLHPVTRPPGRAIRWRPTMKLTDTQTAVLTAAAARPDGAILPLPAHIRGGAIGKVCDALVAKGLAINVGLPGKQTLVISDDGRRALGLEISPMPQRRPSRRRAAPGRSRRSSSRCSRRRKVPAPRRSSPPSAGSPTRSAERSPARSRRGSACRSDPRRSRVADASTASCRDRAMYSEPFAPGRRARSPRTRQASRRGHELGCDRASIRSRSLPRLASSHREAGTLELLEHSLGSPAPWGTDPL